MEYIYIYKLIQVRNDTNYQTCNNYGIDQERSTSKRLRALGADRANLELLFEK